LPSDEPFDMIVKIGRNKKAYTLPQETNESENIAKERSLEGLLIQEDLDKIEIEAPKKTSIDEKLLYDVALYCIETGFANINSIQINFGLRFNTVLTILEELEKRGVLSPKERTKGRTTLVDKCELGRLIKIE
ncbi:MAG: hypothetical protein K2N42_02570, partial [Anaeroplasmataceae bacterium]|nr:hypothetical protein [Anaeroplasmataceae bacterium]